MKRLIRWMAGLLTTCGLLLTSPAFAESLFEQRLGDLTEASLAETQALLEALEAEGDPRLLPLFDALFNGNLFYIDADQRLVAADPNSGAAPFTGILSGEVVASLTEADVTKVRVNNRLRRYLNDALARLKLTAPDPDIRLAAVNELLTQLNPGTVAQLDALRADEPNAKVRAALDAALNLYTAQTSERVGERVQAIEALGGSLENAVRNSLAGLAEDDSAPEAVRIAAADSLQRIEQKFTFYSYVDQLFFGLSLGSVLLLAAFGLAITFGVMGVINMAHGEMLMLGAYTTFVVQQLMPNAINQSIWVAIPMAFLVAGSFGVLIERCVIRFLHGRPLETLLATFGISLILQQLVRTIFSPLNRRVIAPDWLSGSWQINPALSLTYNRLYILIFALIVFAVLVLIMKKTSLGLQVRAVSQNRAMAKAMGIKTDWVDALTFGLGSGIAGIGGVALSQLTNVGPNLGQSYIIDSFMVVVFGGVGNLYGTLVAAFTLGVANKFLEPITGTVLATTLMLVFIILFIQKKPKGLFPQRGRAAE